MHFIENSIFEERQEINLLSDGSEFMLARGRRKKLKEQFGCDEDQCQSPNACDPNADCQNRCIGYTCNCHSGFKKKGRKCLPLKNVAEEKYAFNPATDPYTEAPATTADAYTEEETTSTTTTTMPSKFLSATKCATKPCNVTSSQATVIAMLIAITPIATTTDLIVWELILRLLMLN